MVSLGSVECPYQTKGGNALKGDRRFDWRLYVFTKLDYFYKNSAPSL